MTPRLKELKFTFYRIKQSPLAVLGVIIITAFIVIAIFAPYLAPPNEPDPYLLPKTWITEPQPPDAQYPMGTGVYGTDIYYGVIWGTRISLRIAFTVVAFSALIGVFLGSIAGYFGGKIDYIVMRLTDMFLAIPSLLLAMGITSFLGRNLINMINALIIVWWPRYARYSRSEVLSVKEEGYIQSAKAVGCTNWQILFRHVLPNSIYPILIVTTMDLGMVVLVAAGLSFLGLGAEQFTAEWGNMISMGRDWVIWGKWWASFFPGLAIFLFVLGWNLLGDAFRDILDPRLRRA